MRLIRQLIVVSSLLPVLVAAYAAQAQGGPSPEMIAREKARVARLRASIAKKMTVPQQKSAYYQIVAAERKAYLEAKKKYPGLDDVQEMLTRATMERSLTQQYTAAAFGANHLTAEEGLVLEKMGDQNKWPAPNRRDPSTPRLKVDAKKP